MGYSDGKYNTRVLVPARFNATSTSTATASGQVVTSTDMAECAKFARRTEITGGKVKVVTAPNAGATTTKLAFLNGTATFAVATIGTLTAGQSAAIGITAAADAMFAADGEPTVNAVSTSTASQTVTQGNYDIYFEQNERFA